MAKYEMKFMFDWAAGTCIWSINEAAREKYGYCVEFNSLPISQELLNVLEKLCDQYDQALDWKSPSNGLIWSLEKQNIFVEEAKSVYKKLCNELGDDYNVILWSNMFFSN